MCMSIIRTAHSVEQRLLKRSQGALIGHWSCVTTFVRTDVRRFFVLRVNVLEINIEVGVAYYSSSQQMHAVVLVSKYQYAL